MEKGGLDRAMEFLNQQNVPVEVIVTDRHRQINKWIRETYPEVKYYYDVWHRYDAIQIKINTFTLYYKVCLKEFQERLNDSVHENFMI